MAQARGFSPPAGSRQTSYMPGVLGNYWVLKLPDTWSLQEDRDCLTPGRLIPGNARTLDRLCRCTGLAATKPGFIAQANSCALSCRLPAGKGPFTLLPEGRRRFGSDKVAR